MAKQRVPDGGAGQGRSLGALLAPRRWPADATRGREPRLGGLRPVVTYDHEGGEEDEVAEQAQDRHDRRDHPVGAGRLTGGPGTRTRRYRGRPATQPWPDTVPSPAGAATPRNAEGRRGSRPCCPISSSPSTGTDHGRAPASGAHRGPGPAGSRRPSPPGGGRSPPPPAGPRSSAPSGGKRRWPRCGSGAGRHRGPPSSPQRPAPQRHGGITAVTIAVAICAGGATPASAVPRRRQNGGEIVLADERVAGEAEPDQRERLGDVPRRGPQERIGHRAVEHGV